MKALYCDGLQDLEGDFYGVSGLDWTIINKMEE
jgi:hypothetical protein